MLRGRSTKRGGAKVDPPSVPNIREVHLVRSTDISEPGQKTITPYFTVEDADRLMRFLIAAFDAAIVKKSRYDDGRVQHARLLIGNSLIMLNESTDAYPANISQMHIVVADADVVFQTALRHGATPVMDPNIRPRGARMAGTKDPCGNIWWLSSRAANAVPDAKSPESH